VTIERVRATPKNLGQERQQLYIVNSSADDEGLQKDRVKVASKNQRRAGGAIKRRNHWAWFDQARASRLKFERFKAFIIYLKKSAYAFRFVLRFRLAKPFLPKTNKSKESNKAISN